MITSFFYCEAVVEVISNSGTRQSDLDVEVCAAHMSRYLDPKFSKEGSFFGRFSLNMGWFA